MINKEDILKREIEDGYLYGYEEGFRIGYR